jgi:hypothetical protein
MARAISNAEQDRIWRAEEDARTLANAEDIKKDAARMKRAKIQAIKMTKEQEKNLASIRKIAKKK